jgi:CelD/BcsL family acetyltransferase involved in cellulose biosynthesis
MNYTVAEENLDNLKSYQQDTSLNLQWSSVFVLPAWMRTWWQVFGSSMTMMILTLRSDEVITGIAPLMRKGKTACFLGDTDVCDYMDFIIAPGMETEFFSGLLDYLRNNGISNMDLAHVRDDSTVLKSLHSVAERKGCKVVVTAEEVSLETELPANWEDYLASLTGKQRHEVKRKLRRLNDAGEIDYRFERMSVNDTMNLFLDMFTESRQDKADFLTEQKEEYFRLLAANMSENELLKFGVLRLDNKAVACIMCFDYNDRVYLYNSGYKPEYNYLSVGLVSKVLSIKESIMTGRKHYDFLKGSEPYKYHLGGKEVVLSRCLIDLH